MKKGRLGRTLAVSVFIAVAAFLATVLGGWSPKLGLDLAGGAEVIFQPTQKVTANALSTAIDIMRKRVDASGVSNALINTEGTNIVVQLPGVKNPDALIKEIGTTAQLVFRPVLCYAPAYSAPKTGSPPPASSLPQQCSQAQYQLTAQNLALNSAGQVTGGVGPDPALASFQSTTPDQDAASPKNSVLVPAAPGSAQAGLRYLLGPVQLTGTAIKHAQAAINQQGQWVVDATTTSAGAGQWDSVAQQNFHQMIGIDLDGQVLSAPITQSTQSTFSSFNGSIEISGSFTQASAGALAQNLNFGALPVRLNLLTHTTTSATLGKSSLKAGLYAGMGGLILVLAYMVLYYRGLGIVVVLGLAATSALLWAIVSALGHSSLNLTLDLAGVTGLIVSIGITADSYVIYFERLKDQVRAGRSVRTSVDRSFKGAFRTVLTADCISLIGAAVLYVLAVGSVKGFAFFLGLSTLMNIFVTYFFTRPLVILLGRNERISEARIFGIARGLAAGSAS